VKLDVARAQGETRSRRDYIAKNGKRLGNEYQPKAMLDNPGQERVLPPRGGLTPGACVQPEGRRGGRASSTDMSTLHGHANCL
jgi:hypothetical protein